MKWCTTPNQNEMQFESILNRIEINSKCTINTLRWRYIWTFEKYTVNEKKKRIKKKVNIPHRHVYKKISRSSKYRYFLKNSVTTKSFYRYWKRKILLVNKLHSTNGPSSPFKCAKIHRTYTIKEKSFDSYDDEEQKINIILWLTHMLIQLQSIYTRGYYKVDTDIFIKCHQASYISMGDLSDWYKNWI